MKRLYRKRNSKLVLVVRIRCSGHIHKIIVTDGPITLVDHPDVRREQALKAMIGSGESSCESLRKKIIDARQKIWNDESLYPFKVKSMVDNYRLPRDIKRYILDYYETVERAKIIEYHRWMSDDSYPTYFSPKEKRVAKVVDSKVIRFLHEAWNRLEALKCRRDLMHTEHFKRSLTTGERTKIRVRRSKSPYELKITITTRDTNTWFQLLKANMVLVEGFVISDVWFISQDEELDLTNEPVTAVGYKPTDRGLHECVIKVIRDGPPLGSMTKWKIAKAEVENTHEYPFIRTN